MAVETCRGELPRAVHAAVTAIAARAEAADGAPPLSDAVLLGTDPATIHLWLASDAAVLGYAAVTSDASASSDWANSADGTIEIVVDPQLRGRGLGAQLLHAAIAAGGRQLWTRGDRPTPHQLAQQAGMVPVRQLWCMTRALSADVGPVLLPVGFHLRQFQPDADEQEVLRVNAEAFVGLPDQGSWTLADLQARTMADWFHPDDLLLLEEGGDVVGFHWTKVHPGGGIGEVYVLAIRPRVQGRQLGRPLLTAGVAHLRERGCHTALLYVDDANEAARGLYRNFGFTDERRDVLYRCVGSPAE